MRAKEFIEANEATLKYPAEIRQIIDEMLPLRSSKQLTEDYLHIPEHVRSVRDVEIVHL